MSQKMRFFLRNQAIRDNAHRAIAELELSDDKPMVIEIKESTRNLEQNAKMWATLSEISKQVVWYGKKLTPTQWKHVLTAALEGQDSVPGIDGGFVVMGKATSQMSIRKMSELIELAHAFGAEQGVKFNDLRDGNQPE